MESKENRIRALCPVTTCMAQDCCFPQSKQNKKTCSAEFFSRRIRNFLWPRTLAAILGPKTRHVFVWVLPQWIKKIVYSCCLFCRPFKSPSALCMRTVGANSIHRLTTGHIRNPQRSNSSTSSMRPILNFIVGEVPSIRVSNTNQCLGLLCVCFLH